MTLNAPPHIFNILGVKTVVYILTPTMVDIRIIFKKTESGNLLFNCRLILVVTTKNKDNVLNAHGFTIFSQLKQQIKSEFVHKFVTS